MGYKPMIVIFNKNYEKFEEMPKNRVHYIATQCLSEVLSLFFNDEGQILINDFNFKEIKIKKGNKGILFSVFLGDNLIARIINDRRKIIRRIDDDE